MADVTPVSNSATTELVMPATHRGMWYVGILVWIVALRGALHLKHLSMPPLKGICGEWG